jgi:putative phosphoribosyl transferase
MPLPVMTSPQKNSLIGAMLLITQFESRGSPNSIDKIQLPDPAGDHCHPRLWPRFFTLPANCLDSLNRKKPGADLFKDTSEESTMELPIPNRQVAGRELARALTAYRDRQPLLVLALPRGGVPVALEVAEALGAELDLMIVRKLGLPGHDELAMCAIASGGRQVLNDHIIRQTGINESQLSEVADRENRELRRRERVYRGEHLWPEMKGATVILVDDGLATGATMRAAVAAVRSYRPRELVVAVPVAPAAAVRTLQAEADKVVCLATPEAFGAISYWYREFNQVSDGEVHAYLARAWGQD